MRARGWLGADDAGSGREQRRLRMLSVQRQFNSRPVTIVVSRAVSEYEKSNHRHWGSHRGKSPNSHARGLQTEWGYTVVEVEFEAASGHTLKRRGDQGAKAAQN